ncbi:MAG: hypothetical protein AAB624_00670 [Patescibacteria group bacterium]
MNEVLLGLVAMGVGGLLCFGGVFTSKVMLSFWGAFVGFLGGSGIVAASTGYGWLQTSMGWLIGLVFAAVMLLITYSFYELAMVGLLGSAGFLLAGGVMSVTGADWNWTVGLVAGLVGVVLALSTFAMDIPRNVLTTITTLVGGMVFVQGLMVMLGITAFTAFETGAAIAMPSEAWGWLVTWLLVTLSGAYTQMGSKFSPVGSRSSWR